MGKDAVRWEKMAIDGSLLENTGFPSLQTRTYSLTAVSSTMCLYRNYCVLCGQVKSVMKILLDCLCFKFAGNDRS